MGGLAERERGCVSRQARCWLLFCCCWRGRGKIVVVVEARADRQRVWASCRVQGGRGSRTTCHVTRHVTHCHCSQGVIDVGKLSPCEQLEIILPPLRRRPFPTPVTKFITRKFLYELYFLSQIFRNKFT